MGQAEQLSNLKHTIQRIQKKLTRTRTHTQAEAGGGQENLHIKSCKGQNLLAREAKASQEGEEEAGGEQQQYD